MDAFMLGADGVVEILKDPAAELPYAVHWYDWLRGSDKYWSPRTRVKPGEIFTPAESALNGHRYRCTVGGQTGSSAPAWPSSGSTPFTDGGVSWVRIGAEDTVTVVTVAAESGLTAANAAIDATGTLTTLDLSGGEHGKSYLVTVTVETAQGKTDERRFRVRVRER